MDNQLKITDVRPAPRFRGQVLNRVYRVWLFRRLLPVLILEVAALAAFLYLLSRAVFVQRVAENAFKVFFANPPDVIAFFYSAFANARPLTQAAAAAFLIALAFLMRHITQGILRFILVRENYFARPSSPQ